MDNENTQEAPKETGVEPLSLGRDPESLIAALTRRHQLLLHLFSLLPRIPFTESEAQGYFDGKRELAQITSEVETALQRQRNIRTALEKEGT